MKFNVAWLDELTGLSLTTDELSKQLTAAGLEVDEVVPASADFSGVVVAKIVAAEPHPDADRLRVCQVEYGAEETLTIVCGAPNARVGLVAPLAKVGAILPGDFKIKPAKLRGVESTGMLCSGKELKLDDDSSGLLELPNDAPIGEDFYRWIQAKDDCITIDLTPNRADCLSLRGLHREVLALNGKKADLAEAPVVAVTSAQTINIQVEAPVDCPRYAVRLITELDPTAQTPMWMRERLRRCGLRSKSPLVDVTNYILLEYGQPLHAFDTDNLNTTGAELPTIGVRRARTGESMTLLNDQTVELNDRYLVITADDHPEALAGVMGAKNSAVTDDTTNVLLESAWFSPAMIMGRSRDLGLSSDAAHRFERGIDPEIQLAALERATELLLDIAGGQAGPICLQESTQDLPQAVTITLRQQRINALLGTDLEADQITNMLQALGMQVEIQASQAPQSVVWQVVPPSARLDIAIEADLIEEVARLFGYTNIPTRLPTGALRVQPLPEAVRRIDRLHHHCIDLGYYEAMTYSFVDARWQGYFAFEADNETLGDATLQNPISQDLAVMRRSLLPGLLQALKSNRRQHGGSVRFFETGTVFSKTSTAYNEQQKLSLVASGTSRPEQWSGATQALDFYAFKGDIEQLLEQYEGKLRFAPNKKRVYLHPGQSATISVVGPTGKEMPIGSMGLLHPLLTRQLKLDSEVFVAELDLKSVLATKVPQAQALSRYPSIRRDLALLVPESMPASEVVDCVRKHSDSDLKKTLIFDVYTGKNVENGYKSLAIGLILQNNLSTLTDEDADRVVHEVLQGLQRDHKIMLRDE